MQVRCWGTRGSIPVPGPHTTKYGGNTSCVEIRPSDGSVIILDHRVLTAAYGRYFLRALPACATEMIALENYLSDNTSDMDAS